MLCNDNILEICELLNDKDKISLLSITRNVHKLKKEAIYTGEYLLQKIGELWYFKRFRHLIIDRSNNNCVSIIISKHVKQLTFVGKTEHHRANRGMILTGSMDGFIHLKRLPLLENVSIITFLEVHEFLDSNMCGLSFSASIPMDDELIDYCSQRNISVNVEFSFQNAKTAGIEHVTIAVYQKNKSISMVKCISEDDRMNHFSIHV
jgi:hypothetical protein